MILESLSVGPLGVNCVLVGDPNTKQAVVVDPGDEAPRILLALATLGLTLKGVLHTHGHIDHVGATAHLCKTSGAPAYMHQDDAPVYQSVPVQAAMLGLPEPPLWTMQPLTDGQVVTVGGLSLKTIHTPGHTMGSCCFKIEDQPVLLSGDTLFAGGVGRTDLGGDWDALVNSIRTRIFTLPDTVRVIAGHGPATTVGKEKKSNPFVRL